MVNKDKAIEIARSTGWLSGHSMSFQDDLLSRCHLRSYAEKETLYHAGDDCSGMYGLVAGVIKLEIVTPRQDFKIASIKQPVSWMGQAASIRRGEYYVTATASTSVTTLFLPHHEIEWLMENASYCRAFAMLTLEHFDEAQKVVSQLLIGSVEDRVAARLALLAERSGSIQSPVVPVTQADLAEMCGLSRPTVQQVLSNFEKRGLIKSGYRRIEILNQEALVGGDGALPVEAVAGTVA